MPSYRNSTDRYFNEPVSYGGLPATRMAIATEQRRAARNRARTTIRQTCHLDTTAPRLPPGSFNLLEILRSPRAAQLAGEMMLDHSREGQR
jgi:hypothetical protein